MVRRGPWHLIACPLLAVGGAQFLSQLRDLVANDENSAGQLPDLAEAFLQDPTAITLGAGRSYPVT
jgi:hypothetical protein